MKNQKTRPDWDSCNYLFAKRSLEIFQNKKRSHAFGKLSLIDINKDWLEDYEIFMRKRGKSSTTISMYLRTFRTIYNEAIEAGSIQRDYYPFGKSKYQPPSATKVKKALSKEDMKTLCYLNLQHRNRLKLKIFGSFHIF
ncbi:MAG: phage integrase SAM-like domain-containing protein [Saprospiraceae bacterium]|nr:phage integrase SAM-like domain-containing protein [Candidatus Brachybacter algidus]